MIYLDNAATTALTPDVISAMTKTMENFGNPSSLHHFGRKASQELRESRETIASLLNASPLEIIFTSGGTESNNTAIKGYALANQENGKHIITTEIEHHSVLNTMKYLEERLGFQITYIKPEDGEITVDSIKRALRDDTILVSTMYANNETGMILPIHEIGDLLKHHKAKFHVDAVQVAGKLDINLEKDNIDFLSLSAHKFHGPKGIGLLYHRSQQFDSLLHGGDQENKRRASTENLIGISGMTQALKTAIQNRDDNLQKVTHLKSYFLESISDLNYYLNESKNSLPYVINIGFPGKKNDILLTQLDLMGIAISTGSACTAGAVEPSHVLESIYGDSSSRLEESVRISLSELNTEKDISELSKALHTILGK
ncbi:hypothetical protein HMPREF9318_00326 [Streptococcus urinalis FB127-CNA-2]|uniref:cysteine desulfurase n=1 Tax=Streptococcus urinalis 2285-97 TaxID=764291 RepID=G5KFR7_9STRE|nr:cysteine desulfurase family protein [Streptococcus urinalis]EHJ57552.1 aminotransferase, class V [Streptococcus urinalis 2285-97]EKS22128.1 hypothetical protein HMPREF9318_00326 [Streptococcus urinalis FB127-CNA-2]VEF31940.1 cysteine desufurase [Streptococcus urinalis]